MKYDFRLALIVVLVSMGQYVYSQNSRRIPSEKPRLIVGIVVDQMRYDYIYRYWDQYSEGGFKKLVISGTFCKNAGMCEKILC